MTRDLWILVSGVAVLVIGLGILITALLDRRRRILTPLALTAALALIVLAGGTTTGLAWAGRERASRLPGTVRIITPAPQSGRVSCQLDATGTATVPEDGDLWLYLITEQSGIYAQGGRPLRIGPANGTWSFSGLKVATRFYRGARYQLVAVIVSKSQSAHTLEVLRHRRSDNWRLDDRDLPVDEQVTPRATVDLVLDNGTTC